MCFSRIKWTLLALSTIFVTISVANTQNKNKNVSTSMCNLNPTSLTQIRPPDCVIRIEAESPDENDYTCVGHSALKVGVDLSKNPFDIVCISTYKMVVKARFLDGYVSHDDSRFQTESFFLKNATNPSVTSIRIRIRPQIYNRRSVRYSVRGKGDNVTNQETVILLVYRNLGIRGRSRVYWLPDVSNDNGLADMSSNYPILKAETEVILIPCFPYGNSTDNVLFVKDALGWAPLPVNGTTITYEPSSGFLLNTTLYPNYVNTYRCSDHNYYEFRIVDLEDLIVFPTGRDVTHYTRTAKIPSSEFYFECSHISPVKLDGTIFFRNGTQVIVHETQSSSSHKPKPRFTVRFKNEGLVSKDKVSMVCTSETSGQILHTWNVLIQDVEEVSNENNKLRLNRNGQYYYCSSDTFDDVSLKWLLVGTVAQFEQIESCIKREVRHSCYQYNIFVPGQSTMCRYDGEHANSSSCEGARLTGGGALLCSAGNGAHQFLRLRFSGHDQIQYFYGEDVPEKAKSIVQKMWDPEAGWDTHLRTKVEYFFECRAHSYFAEGDFHWLLEFANKTRIILGDDLAKITYDERIHLYEVATASTRIIFFNTDIVNLVCRSPSISSDHWIESKLNISITNSESPRILTRDRFEFKVDAVNQIIVCEANGFPIPVIKWSMKDGQNISRELIVDGGTLKFPKFESSMSAIYICNASNVDGYDVKEIRVSEEQDNAGVIIGIVVGVSVLIIIGLMATSIYYRLRIMDILDTSEIDEFFNGSPCPDSDEGVKEGTYTHATNKLPYPMEFEVPNKESLNFDEMKLLGSGEFGQVYLGNFVKDSIEIPVAVKVPKPQCPTELFKMHLSELKIMAYMGEHENVVRLIGAYTAEIRKGILMIAIEYCEMGSLEEFLEQHKDKYGNENPAEMKPVTQGRYVLSLDQFLANLFGFAELVEWSRQIAAGMEFLTSKKIIHGDLATRNVLLSADRTAKISDFGLSRRLYHYENYIKSTQVALPWRWMAVESLTAKVFSSQSDVWSFGITMWEIFSLENTPYPGLDWDITFGNQLKNGLRNIQPDYATSEIYQIMVDCWQCKPEDRPSFTKLKSQLSCICPPVKSRSESFNSLKNSDSGSDATE